MSQAALPDKTPPGALLSGAIPLLMLAFAAGALLIAAIAG